MQLELKDEGDRPVAFEGLIGGLLELLFRGWELFIK